MREDAGQLAAFDRLRQEIASLPATEAAARVDQFFTQVAPDPATRQLLAEERRDQVGELDGAPWKLRVDVNRERLTADRNAIRAAYDPDADPEQPLSQAALDRMDDGDRTRLNTLNRMLAPNVVTSHDFQGRPVKTEVPRQFLSLATEDDGKMVEVLGDLSTAKHITYVMHGIGVTLDDPTQVDVATAIHNAVGPADAATLNVIYDAPNDIGSTLGKEHAYAVAETMPHLIAGVATQIRPDAITTLTTHSHGTIAGAETVRDGRAFVHNVDFKASPGLGHDINSVADLNLDPRIISVTASRAPGDGVSVSQFHGKDPADFPADDRFKRLATSLPGGPSVTGHEQFWRDGSESLVNTGRLARGEYGQLTTTDTSLAEENKVLGVPWAGAARAVSTPVGKWLAPALGDRTATTQPPSEPAVRRSGGPGGPTVGPER